MSTFYLDFEGGNDANDGTSFANRWKTIASGATAARIAPGDTIRMMSSLDPTALGNATWTNASTTVTLATATTTKIIDDGENAWTASANVTANTSGTWVENNASAQFIIAAGFTTGIVAYKAFASRDYSAYQQINLLIRPANGTVASGVFRIDLCSDGVGAVPVNSFTINMALNPSLYWHKIVMDYGSALGSAITSVAVYAISDPGTFTMQVDDIFASKAPGAVDCLTLNSLIRLTSASGNDGHWYNVTSVNGATVKIGGKGNDNTQNSTRGYYGTTATTQATQVRQCIVMTGVTADGTSINAIQDAGGATTGYITFSGGWNRTDMTTQTGYTCLIAPNGEGYMWDYPAAKGYVAIEYCMAVYCYWGFRQWGTYQTLTNCHAIQCIQHGFMGCVSNQSARNTYTGCYATACGTGFYFDGNTTGGNVFSDCHADGCTSIAGFNINSNLSRFINCSARGNSVSGWFFGSGASDFFQDQMIGCTTSGNATQGIKIDITGSLRIKNCLISDSTEFATVSNVHDHRGVISTDHDQVAGDVKHYSTNYTIATATDQRHTASGYSWKFTPGVNFTSNFPLKLRIGAFRVRNGVQFTATCWGRKDTANTNVVLCCPGGQVSGIASDVNSSSVSATNTWEQLSLSATPSADGVVEIWAYFYSTIGTSLSSSTLAWVDDFGFTP